MSEVMAIKAELEKRNREARVKTRKVNSTGAHDEFGCAGKEGNCDCRKTFGELKDEAVFNLAMKKAGL